MGMINESPQSSQGRDSHIPMDVKFEEEPYEDEDWFLMLLSELIFDNLKLEKPEIVHVAVIAQESQLHSKDEEDKEAVLSNEEPDLKQLLVREGPIDNRFPLMDQILMPQTARKALFLIKWGLVTEAKDVLMAIEHCD